MTAAAGRGTDGWRHTDSDLPTEVTESSPRFRAEREKGESLGAKSSRAKVAKSAKGNKMNRPNTRANQSCRSPYSACLRREADLKLQAMEPNTVRPDAFGPRIRPSVLPLRPCGRILPSSFSPRSSVFSARYLGLPLRAPWVILGLRSVCPLWEIRCHRGRNRYRAPIEVDPKIRTRG